MSLTHSGRARSRRFGAGGGGGSGRRRASEGAGGHGRPPQRTHPAGPGVPRELADGRRATPRHTGPQTPTDHLPPTQTFATPPPPSLPRQTDMAGTRRTDPQHPEGEEGGPGGFGSTYHTWTQDTEDGRRPVRRPAGADGHRRTDRFVGDSRHRRTGGNLGGETHTHRHTHREEFETPTTPP